MSVHPTWKNIENVYFSMVFFSFFTLQWKSLSNLYNKREYKQVRKYFLKRENLAKIYKSILCLCFVNIKRYFFFFFSLSFIYRLFRWCFCFFHLVLSKSFNLFYQIIHFFSRLCGKIIVFLSQFFFFFFAC